MLVNGFKFGILLQFAVDPVCLYIFQTASLQGFAAAEAGALGVGLIDGLYILAAILGMTSIIQQMNINQGLKIFGAATLFIFGLNMIIGLFDKSLLPSLNIADLSGINNAFVYALILTASSPLTILFWAGVFSTKIAQEHLDRKQIYLFGLGALLSTILFLTLIAFIGSLTQAFVTPLIIQVMNLAVGLIFIYFAIKMIMKKTATEKTH
ncbi:LysE family translocator [Paenibacillus wynnii]|uniref:LysE family translocator n=1 Tax=Paenibacillus wynnii TaxID=268407 RepID=UPI00278FE5B4|nr:LysE family transporter [Paenibacillus wynnii]MDQ0194175.1 threonine/homoserine/homoserine lactone efflux protein [Paenibacillus wynnii]